VDSEVLKFGTDDDLARERAALVEKRDRLKRELGEIHRSTDGDLTGGTAERWDNLSRGIDRVDADLRVLDEQLAERARFAEKMAAVIARGGGEPAVEVIERDGVTRGGYDGTPQHVRRDRDMAFRTIERHKDHLSAGAGDRLDTVLRQRDRFGATARYLSAVGDPAYSTAIGKMIADPTHGHLRFSPQEVEAVRRVSAVESERALSLTGSAGGFAVPFELDPTILLTSDGAVNPIREIARVESIGVDEWRGVSSAGVTASFTAEATEATDNAPTLAQPTVSTEKAQAWVPFSIEVGMDWESMQSELARVFADAKNTLEAAKFITGSGTNEPFGVLTGTTNTVNAAAGADAFTSANLYSLMAALPPRFRPRGVFVADLAIINRIAQFESAAGARLFPEVADGRIGQKRLYEASEMPNDATTGNKFVLFGDFSYYLIADRIGLTIELVQHVVGTNHRPTGQRGLYAFWRVGAKVLDASAFRALLGTA
jgi:HK97 family phage major capsid protein